MNTHLVSPNTAHRPTGQTIYICLIATIGGFLFGFDSGVINGTVEGLRKAFESSSMGTGFNVSSMLLGCAIGAYFAGRCADMFGRKPVLMAAALAFIASAWGSGIADGSIEFIIYRILGGLAVGAASVISPAYISEVSPTRYRGRLSSVQQIAIISGLFGAFLSNYALAKLSGGTSAVFWSGFETWRWMFWIELIPASLFFVLLWWIPESPRYLVMRERDNEARDILNRLDSGSVDDVLSEIRRTFAQKHDAISVKDLVKQRKLPTVIIIGMLIAAFSQFTGINVVFYYGAVLWGAAGFEESDALLINVVSGGLSILACLMATYLVDKVGRKPLLFFGAFGMSILLGLISFAFAIAAIDPQTGQLNLGPKSGILALVSANLYVIVFNCSWGPISWVMLGEMFPNRLRGTGLALGGLAMWVANFFVTMTFPIFLSQIGLSNSYIIYAVCTFISGIFVWRFVRETNGLSLEEME